MADALGKTITFRISRMIKRYADNRLEIQTSVIKKSTHRELRGFTLSWIKWKNNRKRKKFRKNFIIRTLIFSRDNSITLSCRCHIVYIPHNWQASHLSGKSLCRIMFPHLNFL